MGDAELMDAAMQGHCIRVTIAGADSKHFTVDLRQPRKLWVHSASGRPSSIMFTVSG